MINEVVVSVLASLGGAALVIGAFAHFLGRIWTDRIAKSTKAIKTGSDEGFPVNLHLTPISP